MTVSGEADRGHGYRVVILAARDDNRAVGLADEIESQSTSVAGARPPVDITVDPSHLFEDPKPDTPTTALVVLGGPAIAADSSVAAAVDACRRALRVCIPIFNPAESFPSQHPPGLHELNGVPWKLDASPGPIAGIVLRLLGFSEPERKVFVSYRRSDGTALASQLRYAFIDAGWDVFLDRFSVPPAAVFQQRLDRDLADKAFVLLLETPEASNSAWVEHEIAFAHAHRLGVMSLSLPETPDSQLFPSVLDDLRLRLLDSQLRGAAVARELTSRGLQSVLDQVEVAHALAFQQRREILLNDCAAELDRCGYDVSPIGPWALLATGPTQDEVVLATPRAPEPRDLQVIDGLRRRVRSPGKRTRGWVVHPLEDIDQDRARLIGWLSRRRHIGPSPVMLLASRVAS